MLQAIHPVRVEGLDEERAWQGATTPPFAPPAGGREGELIDFSAPDDEAVTLPSGESVPANALLEWEVPREPPEDWPEAAHEPLARFWEARIARQREIDASIAAKADFEYLYDKPYEDRRTVRVAGPFTVESLSPHRILGVDEHGELIDRGSRSDGPLRRTAGLRHDDPGQPAHGRRAAGAQGRPNCLRLADALAR